MALNLRDFLQTQGLDYDVRQLRQQEMGRIIIKDGTPYLYMNGTCIDLRKCAFTGVSMNAMYGSGDTMQLQIDAILADGALSYGGIVTDDFERITPQDRGQFLIKRVHYKKQTNKEFQDGLRCIWNGL